MADAPGNVVVVLAGAGSRVGLDVPKQLVRVAGRPILEHTLELFERHPDVDEVIVTMTPGHLDAVRAIVSGCGFRKVTHVLDGAETPQRTTRRALARIGDTDRKVLLHDAVRPLLSPRIVPGCFDALDTYDAVAVAVPSSDAIVELTASNTIKAIPRRESFLRGQTPQAFRASVLKQAHDLAAKDPGFVATDDCGVVLRYLPDVPVWVVRGDERNMRITEPVDVYLADKLFRLIAPDLPPGRTEDGYREALEDRTVVVFGGSHGVGADIAALAGKYGAQVRVFSRSGTGTHVQRREDVAAAARDVLAERGSVDFVVNTAVVLPHGPLAQASEETVYGATEVNYLAPILIAQEFFPHLRQTRGSLLLFTSSAYARGHSGYSLYSSAKAAVANLTQALADEWTPHGVRVNCVNPESNSAQADGFRNERRGSLLDAMSIARASLDAMLSTSSGRMVDLRRADPASTLNERSTLTDGAAAAEITQ